MFNRVSSYFPKVGHSATNDNFCMHSFIVHTHLIKAIGRMKVFYAEKHQLSSMTSMHSHLVKRLLVLLVLQFNREI